MTTKSAPSSTAPASEPPGPKPFPIRHIAEIEQTPEQPWMVEKLWFASGVGILGGEPKLGKTFIAAELAIAVASAGRAFGRYPAQLSRPVLFYGPEDGAPALRRRFEDLAATHGHCLSELPIYVLDVAHLGLDRRPDLLRMRATIEQSCPRLVVLDPFVRLVTNTDENSAGEVSAVLGSLRAIQRDYDVAVLLVHHTRKSPAARPGQALRGSGDFAAWSDTNLYLSLRRQKLWLQMEHRHARTPEPIALTLIEEPPVHMALLDEPAAGSDDDVDPLAVEVLDRLELSSRPLSTVELRRQLHKRKADVVRALESLRLAGRVERRSRGWVLTASD